MIIGLVTIILDKREKRRNDEHRWSNSVSSLQNLLFHIVEICIKFHYSPTVSLSAFSFRLSFLRGPRKYQGSLNNKCRNMRNVLTFFTFARCYTLKLFYFSRLFRDFTYPFSRCFVLKKYRIIIFRVSFLPKSKNWPLFTACNSTHSTRIHQKNKKSKLKKNIFAAFKARRKNEFSCLHRASNLKKLTSFEKFYFQYRSSSSRQQQARKKKNVDVDSGWRKKVETTNAIFTMSEKRRWTCWGEGWQLWWSFLVRYFVDFILIMSI